MILTVFAICLAASVIGGICGIGGGVVIKPVLDVMNVASVSTVSFLSGLTVLSMAVVNVYKSRKSGSLDAKRSVPLGIGAAVGGICGKQLFMLIKHAAGNDRLVGAVQAVTLGLLVLGTLLYVLNKSHIKTWNLQKPFVGVGIGLVLGICSSFLGIGGGPMNLAVLYYFYSMETKQAAINSILVILISQTASLLLTLITASVPEFDILMLAAMVGAGITGGLISSKLHKMLSARVTDRLFIGLLTVILLICVYNTVNCLA